MFSCTMYKLSSNSLELVITFQKETLQKAIDDLATYDSGFGECCRQVDLSFAQLITERYVCLFKTSILESIIMES